MKIFSVPRLQRLVWGRYGRLRYLLQCTLTKANTFGWTPLLLKRRRVFEKSMNSIAMRTYYVDLDWRGGVVVTAESAEHALLLIKNESFHGVDITDVNQLTELQPNDVYTFMGDS